MKLNTEKKIVFLSKLFHQDQQLNCENKKVYFDKDNGNEDIWLSYFRKIDTVIMLVKVDDAVFLQRMNLWKNYILSSIFFFQIKRINSWSVNMFLRFDQVFQTVLLYNIRSAIESWWWESSQNAPYKSDECPFPTYQHFFPSFVPSSPPPPLLFLFFLG